MDSYLLSNDMYASELRIFLGGQLNSKKSDLPLFR